MTEQRSACNRRKKSLGLTLAVVYFLIDRATFFIFASFLAQRCYTRRFLHRTRFNSWPKTFSNATQSKINQLIAGELNVGVHQVAAAVTLLNEGATVPFIARYRKEVTGDLDDTQLRNLEERLLYLRELEDRRETILASIEEQGKLTDELRDAVENASTKQALEDIYLPYKPKRRTKAQIAREAGLEPLADALLGDPNLDPQEEAAKYVNDKHGGGKRRAGH